MFKHNSLAYATINIRIKICKMVIMNLLDKTNDKKK